MGLILGLIPGPVGCCACFSAGASGSARVLALVAGDGVLAGVRVPGGGGGLGVFDERAVGGVVLGAGDQDGGAGRDAERGGGVVVGGCGGVFLAGPGGAAAGGLGDVGQRPSGQGRAVGQPGCVVSDGRGVPGDGEAGGLAAVAAGFGAAQGPAAGGDAQDLGDMA